MRDDAYRIRLHRDILTWQEQGWVTPQGASAILVSLGNARSAFKTSALIAVLGAVLLGFGAIGLVAANWDAIPRFMRFLSLVSAMGASYGVAAWLQARRPLFAEAALLVAGLVFAASIALIGQTYHLAGEFADAVLMWTLGCLAGALLTRSAAMTTLAIAGAAYWTGLLALDNPMPPHWPSLALVLAALAVAVWIGWRFARLAGLLALGLWLAITILSFGDIHKWPLGAQMVVLASAALAVWAAGAALAGWRERRPRLAALGQDALAPALPAFLLALGLLQVVPKPSLDGTNGMWLALAGAGLAIAVACAALAVRYKTIRFADAVLVAVLGGAGVLYALWAAGDGFLPRLIGSCLVLAGCLWTVSLGLAGRQPAGRALGLSAFAAEVAYVYVETFGTMLDTAFALLGGGVLFLLLAVTMFKIDRRLSVRALGGSA